MKPFRRFRARVLKLFSIAALLGSTLIVVGPPTPAGAVTDYFLDQTRNFPSSEPEGWITCLHRNVTLPALPSTERYAWEEFFPEEASEGLVNFQQTFHGTFYWTVCVASMKGVSQGWAYREYSMMTLQNSACTTYGHCTTYELAAHYLYAGGNNLLWGSEIWTVPADQCTVIQDGTSTCEQTGGVSVTTS